MLHDRKITVVPQTPLLALLITKYKLKPHGSDMMQLCRLTEGIFHLAEKMMYDINNGITLEDIQEVITQSELFIPNQEFYQDLLKTIDGSAYILLTTIILNDIANTVKYVTCIDDYKIIVETMRM